MVRKKYFRVLIAVLLSLYCVSNALAFSSAVELPTEDQITPYYTGLTSVYCNLSIDAYGKATCYASARIDSGYTGKLTLGLYKSTDRITWTRVTSWSTSGSGRLVLDKTYYVGGGYYYQCSASVYVYDSNDKQVEFETLSSASQYF